MPGTKTRVAAIATLAIALSAVTFGLYRYGAFLGERPEGDWLGLPSDSFLIASFLGHRAEFERLVAMAAQETSFSAPTSPLDARWSRRPGNLDVARWSEYQRLWQSAHLLEGFAIDGDGVFLVAAAGSGARLRGFAYLPPPTAAPMTVETLDRSPVPDPHRFVWFRAIEGDWYLWRVWDEP